jgi:hypothetical protein
LEGLFSVISPCFHWLEVLPILRQGKFTKTTPPLFKKTLLGQAALNASPVAGTRIC